MQFLESFAKKNISSSEDRLEQTKRRKLAQKAEKLVELMMVSGIPTASGYEERIRFSEMEVVDRGAKENGLVVNVPQGHNINGWDVNVASVRTTSVKRHVRYHTHAVGVSQRCSFHDSDPITNNTLKEYLIRVKEVGKDEIYVGRRYADFVQLHKKIRLELPGKVLSPLPRRSKQDGILHSNDDDNDSISSGSTNVSLAEPLEPQETGSGGGGLRGYLFGGGHKRNSSRTSLSTPRGRSPRASGESVRIKEPKILYREQQRVSLRAFLRTFLQNEQIAHSNAMKEFLTGNPIILNEEEMEDVEARKEMDEKRLDEQKKFYEIARKRAQELDVHMELFRREIVERSEFYSLGC